MCLQVDLIIQNVEEMQESQQRLLDEQLQLSLDTNKTGLSISSHDSQIDVLDQYTKVRSLNFDSLRISFLEIQFTVLWPTPGAWRGSGTDGQTITLVKNGHCTPR